MSSAGSPASAPAADAPGPWAPLARPAFAVLWAATVLSNIGTWMNDVGAGWLMTELSPSPFVVAAVQAATTLPVFLFALPVGALADVVDRRRLLIACNAFAAVTAAVLAILVALDAVGPGGLLAFTFLLGAAAAFMAPAWQALVPRLVPREELASAVALNSLGINISRAIGPALGGLLIVSAGLYGPFAVNALSFVVIIAALLWWSPAPAPAPRLPAEPIGGAILAGLRYAMHSRPLLDTLLRAAAFFAFASAYWAMLPLIARQSLGGGPGLYGVLLGALGAGAVAGALVLPAVRKTLGPDRMVVAGTVGTALVLLAFAAAPGAVTAGVASALAGFCWIAVLSTLHVSAQTALPDWVRARGLSIFLTVFFGAMSAGSLIWGRLAGAAGIDTALMLAAAGAVLAIPLVRRARLGAGAELDLAPAMHWPAPLVALDDVDRRGPVMVQVAYRIDDGDRARFRRLMAELGEARRRIGAFGWSVTRDVADPRVMVETWYEASWTDHLSHHERVTGSDRDLQERVRALHRGEAGPQVRHFVSLQGEEQS